MSRGKNLLYFIVSVLALILTLVLIVAFAVERPDLEPEDPHAGQVYLYDGNDWIWMTPLQGVPVNTLTADQFTTQGRVRYLGSAYTALRGVDVSEHQLEIDWPKVAASGLDFACIRVGRRGYTEGGLFLDPWFEKNIKGAGESGLKTSVYFFSQAISVSEAIEEANFVLEHIAPFGIKAPVVYDWELVKEEGVRTEGLSVAARTDCAVAFCETIRRAGYTPCVYFNRELGYYGYDLTRLTDYMFWFSLPESPFPNFYYACNMWQYSFTDQVPGIEGSADMNLWFVPLPPEPLGEVSESAQGNT